MVSRGEEGEEGEEDAAFEGLAPGYSDGAILGSREFVEEPFQTQRHRFGPKRSSGARRLRGLTPELYSVRDLQKNVFS